MSPAEYLSTSFADQDFDYVKGELIARPMPVFEHGQAQGRLFSCFDRLSKTHQLFASVEQRLEVAEDIYRVADVAVFVGSKPDPVPSVPPLVVAEIISHDDRWSELMHKLEEYSIWGVPHIWLVDLDRRALLVYTDSNVQRVESFKLAGYPIEIRIADLAE